MGKSKKGGNYEREFSKALSLWYSDGDCDDIFWRTSGSGARATTRRKQQKKTRYEYGDISFRDPTGQPFIDYFLLELKRGYSKGIDVLDFLDKKKGDILILKWWKKAEEEKVFAERKSTMLVVRRDGKAPVLVVDKYVFKCFRHLGYAGSYLRINSIKNDVQLVMLPLDDFFKKIPSEKIRRLIEK